MKVSVVVPAFNEERLLGDSLRAIRAAMKAFEDAELIICDNNSTDRTAEIARAAGARVVFEPVNQISRARNAGAAQAGGDWIVFVDADSTPSRELFAEIAELIAGGRCLAGGSTIGYENTHWSVRVGIALWNGASRLGRWAAGSLVFCEAAAFREAGGFSEQLYAGEELDLFRKLKRMARAKGREIVILHRHPLLTSDRKLRLWGWKAGFRFILRVIATRGRALRSRTDCYSWYDGRR